MFGKTPFYSEQCSCTVQDREYKMEYATCVELHLVRLPGVEANKVLPEYFVALVMAAPLNEQQQDIMKSLRRYA